jgi:hypothetical protein
MIGFEFIFGTNENKIDNILSQTIGLNDIVKLHKYYTRYQESVEFINRHGDSINYETIQRHNNAKKYLFNYGYIFFLKLDYTLLNGLSYNEFNWILSYFNDIYLNIIPSLKNKFIESIEKKIFQTPYQLLNIDFITLLIHEEVFIEKYLYNYELLEPRYLEYNTILGKIIAPIEYNFDIKNVKEDNYKLLSNNLYKVLGSLYDKYPNKLLELFKWLLINNEAKAKITNQCYFNDSINTYSFLINIMVFISKLVSRYENQQLNIEYIYNTDCPFFSNSNKSISGNDLTLGHINSYTRIFFYLFGFYRVTFYSLILQNINCKNELNYNSILQKTYDEYFKINSKYLNFSVFNECVLDMMIIILRENPVIIDFNENILYEIIYFLNDIIERTGKTLTKKKRLIKTIIKFITDIISIKEINPFIKIKSIQIIFHINKNYNVLLEMYLNKTNYNNFFKNLQSFYLHIENLSGLDAYNEKFFYKSYILEIFRINKFYQDISNLFISIVLKDIYSSIENQINYLSNIILNTTVEISAFVKIYEKINKIYLDLISYNLDFILFLLDEYNSNIHKDDLDIKFNIIKFVNNVLKVCYNKKSDVIKIKINNEENIIWNNFKKYLIEPFSSILMVLIKMPDISTMLNVYYTEFTNYLQKLDIHLGTEIFEYYIQKRDENVIDDIPLNVDDEFLDPILCIPIRNPVILPNSLVFMDRAVIESHLTTNNFDPFSRSPLSIDELNEFNNTEEIKIKIIDFIYKRNQNVNNIKSNLEI